MLTEEVRQERSIEASRVVPVFGVLLLVISGLAAINAFLAHVSLEHRNEIAHQMFLHGQELRNAGRDGEALEEFRSAYNRDPGNAEYHLGFVRALLSTGRTREARNSLEDLLRKRPADGAANTEMAHVLARSGEWRDAAWYYHRALYGQWSRPADLRALRFEVADLLAAHGARQELLAELLLLGEPETGSSEAKHIGKLLLAAGDWARAEQLYRTELRNRSDTELWAGLGRAQLGSGKFLAAERSFRRAGDHQAIREEAELVARVNALDPTLRRLGAAEKHRRAHELATLLATAMQGCMGGKFDKVPQEHKGSRQLGEFTEADLDLVDELWNERASICPAGLSVPREVALAAAQVSR